MRTESTKTRLSSEVYIVSASDLESTRLALRSKAANDEDGSWEDLNELCLSGKELDELSDHFYQEAIKVDTGKSPS